MSDLGWSNWRCRWTWRHSLYLFWVSCNSRKGRGVHHERKYWSAPFSHRISPVPGSHPTLPNVPCICLLCPRGWTRYRSVMGCRAHCPKNINWITVILIEILEIAGKNTAGMPYNKVPFASKVFSGADWSIGREGDWLGVGSHIVRMHAIRLFARRLPCKLRKGRRSENSFC